METKSLFNLHRALAQPVKMCMFDFPVSILDDLYVFIPDHSVIAIESLIWYMFVLVPKAHNDEQQQITLANRKKAQQQTHTVLTGKQL
ncbi:hypothetical protein D4764_05G0009220 [Takifugu flavidus]|uniref:Uncharacterized protein n=1 Tax=Takifugu flavidus TaxID=433684 RepID=A0A5C6N061_9TELE|nr:hypothetical protein D4764_05G0009220 [Takifugu flavidus]